MPEGKGMTAQGIAARRTVTEGIAGGIGAEKIVAQKIVAQEIVEQEIVAQEIEAQEIVAQEIVASWFETKINVEESMEGIG